MNARQPHRASRRDPFASLATRASRATRVSIPPLAFGLIAAAQLSPVAAQNAPLRNAAPPAASASAPAFTSDKLATTPTSNNGSFVLKEVRFKPTRAVPEADLRAVVKPFIGQQIDATTLTVIATAVRQVYGARGFGMAGVGYPNQDLSQGVLQIAVVEPTVARISVESPAKPPVSTARATGVLERAGVRAGQPLDLQALDRAMFTLNDWPGVAARTTLLPTGDEGVYRVNVQTERRRAWDASIDFDNHGSSASGRYRLGTLLRWNNPLSLGDNLDLRVIGSNGNGTLVGRLGYETPIGATPWRAGVGISRVGYELSEAFAGATGTANVWDASLSYPWVRSRERNLVSRLGYQNKRLSDDLAGFAIARKTIRAAELSLVFESRSAWGGGGFNGGSLAVQRGQLTDDSGFTPATGAPDRNFTKVNLQLSRLQALSRTVSLYAGVAGQWTPQILDNAERFTLGGDRGVRAYPVAEGSSDVGAIVNTELRWWVNPAWSTYGFFDWGQGRDRAAAVLSDDRRTLHGYGLGVQFSDPTLFTLKAAIALRGSEPVRSESDNPKARLLVQLQRAF